MKYIKLFEDFEDIKDIEGVNNVPLLKDLLIEELNRLEIEWKDASSNIRKKNRTLVLQINLIGLVKLLKYSKYNNSRSKIIQTKVNRLLNNKVINSFEDPKNYSELTNYFSKVYKLIPHDLEISTFYVFHHYIKKSYYGGISSDTTLSWNKNSITSIEEALCNFVTRAVRIEIEKYISRLVYFVTRDRNFDWSLFAMPRSVADILFDSAIISDLSIDFLKMTALSPAKIIAVLSSNVTSDAQKNAASSNPNYDAIEDISSAWDY